MSGDKTTTITIDYQGVKVVPYNPNTSLERHPLSKCWGSLSPEAAIEFKEQVSKGGITAPIDIYEGRVLDGWHRYTASRALGIDCPAQVFLGGIEEAREHVARANLHRRHLSAGDIALALMRIFKDDISGPGGDPAERKMSIKRLADKDGVSASTLTRAKKALDEAEAPPAETPEAPADSSPEQPPAKPAGKAGGSSTPAPQKALKTPKTPPPEKSDKAAEKAAEEKWKGAVKDADRALAACRKERDQAREERDQARADLETAKKKWEEDRQTLQEHIEHLETELARTTTPRPAAKKKAATKKAATTKKKAATKKTASK